MSGRFFLDTNVLLYSFDQREPGKREVGRQLVREALARGNGIVSFQVVQEFLNVATRKLARPLSATDAGLYMEQVLAPLCQVFPTMDLYRDALGLAERWRYSFYDSLILAAAHAGGCDTLYSEDLQDGQVVEGLRIRDPFAD